MEQNQSPSANRIQLKVEGMRCQGCADAAQAALKAVAGVESACVKLSNNTALVTGNVGADVLIAALAEKSFDARIIA